jgi:hypothetical protein
MNKKPPSRKNTRTCYLEDSLWAVVTTAANQEYCGNKSEYVKGLIMKDFKERLVGDICRNRNYRFYTRKWANTNG